MICAAEDANFGFPEIKIGTLIPAIKRSAVLPSRSPFREEGDESNPMVVNVYRSKQSANYFIFHRDYTWSRRHTASNQSTWKTKGASSSRSSPSIAKFSVQAMEIILTGASISGTELAQYGLVNTALPAGEVLPKALELASTIAAMSGPVARLAKEAILQGKSDLSSSEPIAD
jgi:hypothetical protein